MKLDLRHYLLFLTLIALQLSVVGCKSKLENSNDSTNLNNNNGDLVYIDDFFDFGSITQGEVVSHTFRFKNNGDGNLIIKDIIPDCGCTKSKMDKMVFKPNEEGKIEIVFDSKGWRGMQYKSVALRTNSPIREKSVTFKANVVVRE